LIDKRELFEKARERNLSLVMIEKDYVLGWVLFGFSRLPYLVFKGGTALSKIYFPGTWRLSEDLDFSMIEGDWEDLKRLLPGLLKGLVKESGIDFRLANEFGNPGYLQLKIQYGGPIGRNWVKVDLRKDDLVDEPEEKKIARSYSDYPDFSFRVESLAEICASKIRTLIERKKCRDYFDLWKLLSLEIDVERVKRILPEKLAVKGLGTVDLMRMFPDDLPGTLQPYWDRELSRLVEPVPEMREVLAELRHRLVILTPGS
jgi:predicted nucleotidyltransferase component of viral defense system